MTAKIDISERSDHWPDINENIHRAAQLTLKEFGYSQDTEISIVLADNAFVQDLNKNYRGKDKPTNVLSFPQDEPGLLGDIILAYETLEHEATEQNKSFKDHSIHMIVHGLLHLLGLDHETDSEAQDMESLEIKILNALGIKNPYEITDSMA